MNNFNTLFQKAINANFGLYQIVNYYSLLLSYKCAKVKVFNKTRVVKRQAIFCVLWSRDSCHKFQKIIFIVFVYCCRRHYSFFN